VAEKGGLSAWQCHFISEKYAIMIEHAETISELDKIHSYMITEYSDPSIRKSKSDNLTIVEKAENYIEMNFAEDISMEEMARKLHVHPSHLMRAFKKEQGITISHYRNLRRIKEAKELILFSNLSMTEIAIMIGFSNPQYFSKLFKEIEGVTPVEYRKMKK
jgi:AraC-like DNA-binding protein